MHTDFFQGDAPYRLLERHASIFQTPRQREWMKRLLRSPYLQWRDDYEKSLLTMFKDGNWYVRDKAQYIYGLCVEAGVLRPTAPYQLWRRRVLHQMRIVARCNESPELPRIILDLLAPYFRCMSPLTSFMFLLDSANEQQFQPDISGALWDLTLETLATVSPMRHFAMFSCERFLSYIDNRHLPTSQSRWRTTDLRARVEAFYKRQAAHQRAMLRQRMAPLHEELMAVAWHPRRVAAALEAGYEIEDL